MHDQYAVIGFPISHSKSPLIHQFFASQTQQNICYQAIPIQAHQLKEFIKKFQNQGGKGLNVTAPLKEMVFELVNKLGPRAEAAGSVNTVIFHQNGLIEGDNTDGLGLINDFRNKKIELQNKHILILGAGGAAKGVLVELLAQNPASIIVANRTEDKAKAIGIKYSIEACSLAKIPFKKYDIIINSIAAQDFHYSLILQNADQNTVCYNMIYYQKESSFKVCAEASHAKYMDGLGMLVEQAAESFWLWRGLRPNTKDVLHYIQCNSC